VGKTSSAMRSSSRIFGPSPRVWGILVT